MSSKAIISHHSSDANIATELSNYLKLNGLDTYLLSEAEPVALNIRARAVQACNEFLVIASRNYQKTQECLELVHYAKDLKKEILVLNPKSSSSYKPFGSLGFIAAASKYGNDGVIPIEENHEKSFQSIHQLIMSTNRPRSSRRIADILASLSEATKGDLEHTGENSDVLVLHSVDATPVAELIQTAFKENRFKIEQKPTEPLVEENNSNENNDAPNKEGEEPSQPEEENTSVKNEETLPTETETKESTEQEQTATDAAATSNEAVDPTEAEVTESQNQDTEATSEAVAPTEEDSTQPTNAEKEDENPSQNNAKNENNEGTDQQNDSIKIVLEEPSNGKSCIQTAKVLIVVVSPGLETNNYCRLIVEAARNLRKPIIPVKAVRDFKPESWLGLSIAGKLYYPIFNNEQAYQLNYDTTPLNDLNFAVKCALSPLPSESDLAQIERLNKLIEESKAKLTTWPPQKREKQPTLERPVKIVLEEPKSDLELHYVHYTVTREDFKPPEPLFDNYGIPLRPKFDCLISYERNSSDLVREVYNDLSVNSVKSWFDVFDGATGKKYDVISAAIESSKLILVFLSQAFQKSLECQNEFKYAANLGKPFVFIISEKNLEIDEWIKPFVDSSYKFEVTSVDDLGILHNNVPRLNCIADAIRQIGAAQPDNNDDEFELSDEIVNLKEILNDALDEIEKTTGEPRFKTCTRCQKQYDPINPKGCKIHRGYYLGKTEETTERWVCCQQLGENSLGCEDADHIDIERKWVLNEHFGTYTWEP